MSSRSKELAHHSTIHSLPFLGMSFSTGLVITTIPTSINDIFQFFYPELAGFVDRFTSMIIQETSIDDRQVFYRFLRRIEAFSYNSYILVYTYVQM